MWDPAATILFITHDLDEALKMGDRIAIMKDGMIAQIGTPTEILTNPADDYVESFVQNVDRTKVIPVQTVMRAPQDGEAERLGEEEPSVSPHTSIAEVLPRVLESDAPVAVRDSGGSLKGVVTQDDVMSEVTRNASTVTQTREAARAEVEAAKTA
jgi:glycine betaine/proline transport system ATP-binding protein